MRAMEVIAEIRKAIAGFAGGFAGGAGWAPVETGLPPIWNAVVNGLIAGGVVGWGVYQIPNKAR